MAVSRKWAGRVGVIVLFLVVLVMMFVATNVTNPSTAQAAVGVELQNFVVPGGATCEQARIANTGDADNADFVIEVLDAETGEPIGTRFMLPSKANDEASAFVVAVPAGWVTFKAQPKGGDLVEGLDSINAMVEPCNDDEPVKPVDVYVTEGQHSINGRMWRTECEAYSQTERCRTEIKAHTVEYENGAFVIKYKWVFNNLTYVQSSRALWTNNPLGKDGEWTAADGRKWRTECDTDWTGGNGCRTVVEATIVEATQHPNGSYTYKQVTKSVFNNIVQFTLAA